MGKNEAHKSQAGFLEGISDDLHAGKGKEPGAETGEPSAFYDFEAREIDLPRNIEYDKNDNPKGFKLTGEVKYDLLKRLAWILLRITVATLFILIFVRGASCNLPGGIVTCT